ncbi:MAG: hypothetical protein NDI69_05520 [Bacteriovoracaceae bacterium]|nr:hypothetical protein [Bacteriovoracaceae bacterium]
MNINSMIKKKRPKKHGPEITEEVTFSGVKLLFLVWLVCLAHGLGGIKRYLIDREDLERLDVSDKAIVNLINQAMAKSFAISKRKVREDQLVLLSKDYNDVIARLDKKIANLNKKSQK